MNPIKLEHSASLLDILIIDDDPDSLLLVSTMIDYVGHRSITARDFDSARQALLTGPAAVVLDLVMPEQTSERVIAELLQHAPDMPVLLISASSEERLAERARECAALGVNVVSTLRKPFWVEALVLALEKAVPPSSEQFLTPN